MNAKTYSLCEAVADMAHNLALSPVHPANSREHVALAIEWAEDFENATRGVKWGIDSERDYLVEVDAFFAAKYAAWRAYALDTVRNPMLPPLFAVETATAGEWADCWTDEHDMPQRFATRAEAEAEIKTHLRDLRAAVKRGDMEDCGGRSDYRIVEVKG